MIYFRSLSDSFDFGKFKYCDLGEVLSCAPDYVTWAIENLDGTYFALSNSAVEQIRLLFPNFKLTPQILYRIGIQEGEYWNEVEREEYERRREMWDSGCGLGFEEQTYERYGGSYAQDEMGYSDDEIDEIFDGDPLAYWNID